MAPLTSCLRGFNSDEERLPKVVSNAPAKRRPQTTVAAQHSCSLGQALHSPGQFVRRFHCCPHCETEHPTKQQ